MSKPKQIAWESWNAKIEDFVIPLIDTFPPDLNEEEMPFTDMETPMELPPEFFLQPQKVVYTPLGPYPEESHMKPSDRWDCWIGHANFDITNQIADTIEKTAGVEALRIMGRYSFFIGVGRMFDIKDVRAGIEKELCAYSEMEVLADEQTKATVDLVKEQLKTNKHWSMLVSPTGEVEYIVSDQMDRTYLEDLGKLMKRKQTIGGIILRGNDG